MALLFVVVPKASANFSFRAISSPTDRHPWTTMGLFSLAWDTDILVSTSGLRNLIMMLQPSLRLTHHHHPQLLKQQKLVKP
jgi:hypothetical protein